MRTRDGISRRTFLALAGAAPFAASATTLFAQYKNIPVGLELYSVRDELTTDLMGTVRRVAGMGYQVVEFYSPYYSWTTAQAKEVRALMDDLGISCPSTHNSPQSFTPEGMGKAIELNQILGSTLIVQASAPRGANTVDGWKAACETFSSASEKLRPLGMTAGFHNHASEWRPVEGQRGMDILAANTPKDFVLQLDAGTCVEAGSDPVAWITANPGRIRSMHCKDWGAGEGRGYSVAFGEGDVPWKALFEAAEATGGIEAYLVEQEIAGPAGQFAMAERCLENWKKLRG
jgi:sugar phosphate isomerase/epimerase